MLGSLNHKMLEMNFCFKEITAPKLSTQMKILPCFWHPLKMKNQLQIDVIDKSSKKINHMFIVELLWLILLYIILRKWFFGDWQKKSIIKNQS